MSTRKLLKGKRVAHQEFRAKAREERRPRERGREIKLSGSSGCFHSLDFSWKCCLQSWGLMQLFPSPPTGGRGSQLTLKMLLILFFLFLFFPGAGTTIMNVLSAFSPARKTANPVALFMRNIRSYILTSFTVLNMDLNAVN